MNAPTFVPPVLAAPRAGAPLHPLIAAAVTALVRLDGWLAARRRRADDLQALAAMSDYELRDLGLHRLDALPAGRLFAATGDPLR